MLIKKIVLLSFLLLFSLTTVHAQEKEKTKKAQPKSKQNERIKLPDKKQTRTVPINPDSLKGFVDVNANGIDDRLEFARGSGKMSQKRKRDRFIDVNGDGICDGRESALGLKKAMHRRKGRGKK